MLNLGRLRAQTTQATILKVDPQFLRPSSCTSTVGKGCALCSNSLMQPACIACYACAESACACHACAAVLG